MPPSTFRHHPYDYKCQLAVPIVKHEAEYLGRVFFPHATLVKQVGIL
jgi:hypothetical protein